MKAVLVRIAADASYGAWNGPVDPDSGKFVYVPIPEHEGTQFHPGCQRPYTEVLPALERFTTEHAGGKATKHTRLPKHLLGAAMHLDPDFEQLTYGDVGNRRGAEIAKMSDGDLVVFYAGLRPIRPCEHRLVYALVGSLVVKEVVSAVTVPTARAGENAHTRKLKRGDHDIVVRAKPGVSGRFSQCISIGEYRDRAYRVRPDILEAWGGLSVRNGYLQRSAVPPRFRDPERFASWLDAQHPTLLQSNW